MSDSVVASLIPRTTQYLSPHSRGECVRRLKENTDGYFALSGDKPARAMVFPGGALIVSRFILANHAPVTVGLQDGGGGTRVSVRTGPLTFVFLVVAALGILGMLGSAIGGGASIGSIVWMVLVLAGLAAAVIALTGAITRRSHDEVREFVRSTLEAAPA